MRLLQVGYGSGGGIRFIIQTNKEGVQLYRVYFGS